MDLELIETLWNVNDDVDDTSKQTEWRINRNIVECKYEAQMKDEALQGGN